MKNKEARVKLNFKIAPNTFVQSIVGFNKEKEKWKVNIIDTVSGQEKLLKKLWKKRGGDVNEFIQSVVEEGGGEVEFRIPRYRMN